MIGIGTYPQGAKFSLVRSYVTLFQVADTWGAPVQSANRFVYTPGGGDPNQYHIVVWDHFWFPSTNYYTLDFMIAEAYYVDIPSGIPNPMPFTLLYSPPTPLVKSAISFRQFGAPPPYRSFTLPHVPPGYWLPDL